jgi:hypothetical protein
LPKGGADLSRADRTEPWELGASPRLADLIKSYGRRLALALRTHAPATVVAYDPATQTATVTVDALAVAKVLDAVAPGLDPNAINLAVPQPPIVLTAIPVRIEGAGDGASYLSWPILPGSTGELHVHDRSIDAWVSRLGQVPVDPVAAWTHSLGDSVLYLGLTEKVRRIAVPTDLTAAVLEASLIKLGRLAALGVARLGDTSSPTAEMLAWMISAQAILAAAGAFFGLPAPVLPVASIALIDAASTKVSAE